MNKRKRHYTDAFELQKYVEYLRRKVKSLKRALSKKGK